MYKMYFDTGVKPYNHTGDLMPFHIWKNGTKQIEYYLERKPEDLRLDYLMPEQSLNSLGSHQIAIKIIDGGMLADYAIFTK